MDAIFMEDCNNNRCEENLASQSGKAMRALRPIELSNTGDEAELGKCHHFSIRGYVSEVRKTNREICWPFHTIGNHDKLEKHADLLPPMAVADFKWWGCKSCLRKAHITHAAIENGTTKAIHNSENIRLKDNGTSFDGNPVVEGDAHSLSLMSDFQITHGVTLLGGISFGLDSFINGKDGHLQPSASYCKKDKESKNAGIHAHELHFGQSSQNPLSEKLGCRGMTGENIRKQETDAQEIRKAATISETHKTGGIISECGTANVSGSKANISERVLQPVVQSERIMLRGENAHNVMTSELEETKLGSKVSETQLNSTILTVITNPTFLFISKNDPSPGRKDTSGTKEVLQKTNSSVQIANKCDTEGPEGGNNKDYKCNGDFVKSQDDNQIHPGESDASNVNLHRRKARKVRMLNDIIKSEVLGQSRQFHLSNGNSAIQCEDDDKIEPAAAKDETLPPDCNLDVVSEENERESFKNNKRKVLSESEDEGPSLIHWLRRVPKKVKAQKCDELGSPGNAIIPSQSLTYASTGKCLHSKTKICGTVLDISDSSLEAQVLRNVIPHVKWQQVMKDNNHAVADGEIAKCINVGKPLSKLPTYHRTGPSGEQLDGSCRDFITHRNSDTTCGFEYGISSPVNRLKDSSGISEYGSPNLHKGPLQILKKRGVKGKKVITGDANDSAPLMHEVATSHSIQTREKQASLLIREKMDATPIRKRMVTSPVSEKQADPPPVNEKQAVLDGIPIEILELLQSNFHKNNQLNSSRFTTRVIENPELNSRHAPARVVEMSDANKIMRDGRLGKLSNITGSDPLPHSQHKKNLEMCSRSVNTGVGVCAVGKQTGHSNRELRAQISQCSAKGRRQINGKEGQGQGPVSVGDLSDVHLCLAPPTSGIQPPNAEPYGTYCSQNYNWNRVMFQNVESQYNSLGMSRQPCRCFPHGAVQINNSQKMQSSIYNSSLFPPTMLLERNPTKATQNGSGLRVADTCLSRLHKIKQKNDVKNKRTLSTGNACMEAGKSGKECSAKLSQPLDLYTNDSISAMHLLRLMDPAVGSASSSLCPTVSNDRAEFLNKFKQCENDYQKDFIGVDMGMRSKYTFNGLGPSEHQTYMQTNSSSLMSPVPRYGGLESFSQKRILSASNNFNALYEFKGTNPGEIGCSSKTSRKEKRKSSHLAIQSKLSEQRPPSGYSHSQDQLQLMLNCAGYSKLSETRDNVIQVGYKNKEEATVPVRSSYQTELCVVNRNPADFSAPDENNEYMISYEDLKPRYVSPKRNKQYMAHPDAPRQQRLLKLAASKWNLRC